MHNDPWKLVSEILVVPIHIYIHEECQITWIGIHRDCAVVNVCNIERKVRENWSIFIKYKNEMGKSK